MNLLPNELLIIVFQKIQNNVLKNLKFVCKRWYNMCTYIIKKTTHTLIINTIIHKPTINNLNFLNCQGLYIFDYITTFDQLDKMSYCFIDLKVRELKISLFIENLRKIKKTIQKIAPK